MLTIYCPPLCPEPTFDISRGSAGPRGVEMDHDVPVTTAGPTLGADAGPLEIHGNPIYYMSQGGFETHSL